MRHFFLPILLGLLFAQTFHAQRVALQGVVVDSSGAGLAGATCALMRTRDSVLVAFATSEPGGRFALRRVAPGDYLLQVSLLDFQTAWQAVAVQAASETQELGSIRLLPGPMMLQAVDIRAERSPLAVRNDTLEYNAAAFKVNPGDPVETLLKKMPGIE
ncbi:MAG TPA: carboxypeptidase-like regulatory domain-containing protein, partial [Saprospiraceae bacterium]|nr:carboxypeptidase-like regulatory domain-containing protein [Saprospiraceae bacterium]